MTADRPTPHGWVEATLGDITERQIDQSGPDRYSIFRYIDISSIDASTKQVVQAKELGYQVAPSRAKQRVRQDDVLVSLTRPNLNAVALVPPNLDGSIASTGFHVLRGILVEPVWLFAQVVSQNFVDEMSRSVQGALYPAIRPDDVRSYKILVPPLPEQQRIAARMEALQHRVRTAREALEGLPALVERYLQTVAEAAFRGGLSEDSPACGPGGEPAQSLLDLIRQERRSHWEQAELAAMKSSPKDDRWKSRYRGPEPINTSDLHELPEGWCWAAAEEIVEPGAEIVYGILQAGPNLEHGVPYVRGVDIQDGVLLLGQLWKTTQEIASRYERSSLRGKDVLLGIIRATKVAIVPEEVEEGSIAQGRTTARFRPSRIILPEYLAAYLDSPLAQRWLHSHYRGIDMPGLNLRDVRRLPIPLSPLNEQSAIVERLALFKTQLESAKRAAMEGGSLLESLGRAIVDKAIRGELVPQNPSDEPAADLLGRIKEIGEAHEQEREAVKKQAAKDGKGERSDVRDDIVAWIKRRREPVFSFDDLRTGVPARYEDLKAAVFSLLDDPEGGLEQFFDKTYKAMRLRKKNR